MQMGMPVSLSERILFIDVFRRLALFGILAATMRASSRHSTATTGQACVSRARRHHGAVNGRHLRFGSMEWLWRGMTYAKFPPMK
jgi:uncharacterized membrane protein YeiB